MINELILSHVKTKLAGAGAGYLGGVYVGMGREQLNGLS